MSDAHPTPLLQACPATINDFLIPAMMIMESEKMEPLKKLRALAALWYGFSNTDDWLFSLPDKEFDTFISFFEGITENYPEGTDAQLKAELQAREESRTKVKGIYVVGKKKAQ